MDRGMMIDHRIQVIYCLIYTRKLGFNEGNYKPGFNLDMCNLAGLSRDIPMSGDLQRVKHLFSASLEGICHCQTVSWPRVLGIA